MIDRFSRSWRSSGQRRAKYPARKKNQQDLDRLYRLHRAQVDPRIASGRPLAEQNQRDRTGDGAQQRDKTKRSGPRFPVDEACGQQHQTAPGDALGEGNENHNVAKWVSQAEHERKAETRKHKQKWQAELRSAETANRPDDMGQQERGESSPGPDQYLAAEIFHGTKSQLRFHLREFAGLQDPQPAHSGHTGKSARALLHGIEDCFSRAVAIFHVGKNTQRGEQFLGSIRSGKSNGGRRIHGALELCLARKPPRGAHDDTGEREQQKFGQTPPAYAP